MAYIFHLLALAFFIIALAKPQMGYTEHEVSGKGRNVMIAMDVSRSMLATDIAPNRLQRAKLAVQDLITALPQDRIGLIAFSGRAFVQAPLTIDHTAILESIEQLDTETIPRGGTNIAMAIELAMETFNKTESANHALVLFSDGDELEGTALEAAQKAKQEDIIVVAIGVGTTSGSIIPDPSPRSSGGIRER